MEGVLPPLIACYLVAVLALLASVPALAGDCAVSDPLSPEEAPSYAVKLVKGARGCTEPTLMIFKLPSEYEVARCVEDENGNAVPDPAVVGVICDEAPPLDVADPDDPNVSQPVWLRIMVENADTGDRVYVRGQAYWYDASGNIHSCTTAPLQRLDTDPGSLANHGKWGASFHERYYLVDLFRAGDGTEAP